MEAPGGRLSFDPEFSTATDGAGRTIRFSRAERAVLTTLAGRPGLIFSRQHLLDAVAGAGSDSSDRNIDFLINRLRRKLGDAARTPRYIATQYGEGYRWIRRDPPVNAATARAFIVVGPIRGPTELKEHPGALVFAHDLRRHLDRQTAEQRSVVFDPDCPSPEIFAADKPTYAVELDLIPLGKRLDCAVTARHFATGRVLHVSRHVLGPSSGLADVEPLAGAIVEAIWKATAHGGDAHAPDAEPLPVRMHNAGEPLATDRRSWVEAEQRLRAMLAQNPESPEAMLMLATAIHSRFVMDGPARFIPDSAVPHAACDEIERLVTAATPSVQDDPIQTLAAAKLLYFLNRGYDHVAVGMAERVLETSTAIASAFVVTGQIRLHEGDIEGGMELLERAGRMGSHGIEFATYLIAIKLQGALATGEAERIATTVAELASARPDAIPNFELYYAGYCPDALPATLEARLQHIDPATATGLIRYTHFTSGRLFKDERHRSNYCYGTLAALCARLGNGFVPDDIRQDLPSLFGPQGELGER